MSKWNSHIKEWAHKNGRDPKKVSKILLREGWNPSKYTSEMKSKLFNFLNEWYTLSVKSLPEPATQRRNPSPDERLRKLERDALSGDREDEDKLAQEIVRQGGEFLVEGRKVYSIGGHHCSLKLSVTFFSAIYPSFRDVVVKFRYAESFAVRAPDFAIEAVHYLDRIEFNLRSNSDYYLGFYSDSIDPDESVGKYNLWLPSHEARKVVAVGRRWGEFHKGKNVRNPISDERTLVVEEVFSPEDGFARTIISNGWVVESVNDESIAFNGFLQKETYPERSSNLIEFTLNHHSLVEDVLNGSIS